MYRYKKRMQEALAITNSGHIAAGSGHLSKQKSQTSLKIEADENTETTTLRFHSFSHAQQNLPKSLGFFLNLPIDLIIWIATRGENHYFPEICCKRVSFYKHFVQIF